MTWGQIATLCASLLIAIFRNQLAKIGDSASEKKTSILRATWKILLFFSSFIAPIIFIVLLCISGEFNKSWVVQLCLGFSILIFNLLFSIIKDIDKTANSAEKKVDAVIDVFSSTKNNYLNEATKSPLT